MAVWSRDVDGDEEHLIKDLVQVLVGITISVVGVLIILALASAIYAVGWTRGHREAAGECLESRIVPELPDETAVPPGEGEEHGSASP